MQYSQVWQVGLQVCTIYINGGLTLGASRYGGRPNLGPDPLAEPPAGLWSALSSINTRGRHGEGLAYLRSAVWREPRQ